MSTFGHIDYDAKLDFDIVSMEAKLQTPAFRKRMQVVLEYTEKVLKSSTKVDSQKLNDRFGS
jgi:hypothetical protein